MKVNLGCGRTILEGWVNCDKYGGPGVDRVFDIEHGLPFPDDSAEEILAAHVLEHLLYPRDAIEECYRVLKPNGLLTIRAPYGETGNLEHLHVFKRHSLNPWLGEDDGRSLELLQFPQFKLERLVVMRQLPFAWHLNKYLGIPTRNDRLGFPAELIWDMRVPEEKVRRKDQMEEARQ